MASPDDQLVPASLDAQSERASSDIQSVLASSDTQSAHTSSDVQLVLASSDVRHRIHSRCLSRRMFSFRPRWVTGSVGDCDVGAGVGGVPCVGGRAIGACVDPASSNSPQSPIGASMVRASVVTWCGREW